MNNKEFKHGIRRANLFKLIFPTVFTVAVISLFFLLPLYEALFPAHYVENTQSTNGIYADGVRYVDMVADTLYYTGYDHLRGNNIDGHFYYSIIDDRCTLYLLSDNVTNGTPAVINNIPIKGRLDNMGTKLDSLLTFMARDMQWTESGLRNSTNTIIVNELNYNITLSIVVGVLIIISISFSIAHICILLFNIIKPEYAYTFASFGHHKDRKSVLLKVSEELTHNVTFAHEGFILTENFLVYSDIFNIAIIPLDTIAWAYKHSMYHAFFRFVHLSYTVRIVTKNNKIHKFVGKSKEDADTFLDALAAKEPDILIGYTEENRENSKDLIQSFLSFLKR